MKDEMIQVTEKETVIDVIGVINQLMDRCHKTAVSKGWWDTDRNIGEIYMLMVTELAEGFEYYRGHDDKSNHIPDFTGQEEEMADICIRVFDYCQKHNLRLGQAILAKMVYNMSRPYRHGNKKC